jgi:hypothetical protein
MRALQTGRVVPEIILKESMDTIPTALEVLAPLVDALWEIENENEPRLGGRSSMQTWEDFHQTWNQQCRTDCPALELRTMVPEDACLTDCKQSA